MKMISVFLLGFEIYKLYNLTVRLELILIGVKGKLNSKKKTHYLFYMRDEVTNFRVWSLLKVINETGVSVEKQQADRVPHSL